MNKSSGKSLLLIELSILLVFFCFSAVVCVNLFLKAQEKNQQAQLLNDTVTAATSLAETLKATDGNLSETADILTGSLSSEDQTFLLDGNTLTLYYNDLLAPSADSDAQVTATVTREETDLAFSYQICFETTEDQDEIYTLSFKAMKSGGSNEN